MPLSERKLPVNLAPSERIFFEHELIREIPDHKLIRCQKAVITPDGVVFAEGKLVPESLYVEVHSDFFGGMYQLYYRMLGSVVKLKKGNYLLAFDAWSYGYFHWMTEFIPRLFKLKHVIRESTVILPSVNNGIWSRDSALKSLFSQGQPVSETGYFSESLEAFHLDLTYRHRPRIPLTVKDLYLSSHLAPSGNYDDEVMKALRNFYFSHYKIDARKPERLIYASRGKAPRRYIVNELEVVENLRALGFEIVFFENLSFREQVYLLSETKFLVSQHGAGLTNLLFMKADSQVLELKSERDSQNHCYFSLASAMNINYLYQFCSSDGRSVQDANITVDVDLLRQNIKQVV
jgi:hypothetical protein